MDNLTDEMRRIKHLFMTYRNGIIADSLRKAGQPFGVIFGLQLPQLREIAGELKQSLEPGALARLAEELHAERNVRESRILAMAIMPPTMLSEAAAREWLADLLTREEADLFPFLLLRHTPHLQAILAESESYGDTSPLQQYAREALKRF